MNADPMMVRIIVLAQIYQHTRGPLKWIFSPHFEHFKADIFNSSLEVVSDHQPWPSSIYFYAQIHLPHHV